MIRLLYRFTICRLFGHDWPFIARYGDGSNPVAIGRCRRCRFDSGEKPEHWRA